MGSRQVAVPGKPLKVGMSTGSIGRLARKTQKSRMTKVSLVV